MNLSRNTYLEINKNNLKQNVQKIIKKYNNYDYHIGVVKANCYGLDDENLNATQTIIEAGCNYLAVATFEEAINIRKKFAKIPILCLGHIPVEFLEETKKANIIVTVHSLQYMKEIEENAIRNLKIHLKIETGMHRLGIETEEELNKVIEIAKNQDIIIDGIYTHIYNANSKHDYDMQIEKFKEIIKNIDLAQIKVIHISASEALINYPKPDFVNGCRLGIIMYGFTNEDDLELKSVVKLHSNIVQIHDLPKGQTVGYNGAFKAEKDTKIGVVPIGYADGIIRKNSGRYVYINDRKYRIVGNICMDMLFVEIDEKVNLYDDVLIFKDNKHIEETAEYLETIPYEVLTEIGKRVYRVSN